MKALVTGAAGFIASHLVGRLIGDDFRVVGMDVQLPTKSILRNIEFFQADIRDSSSHSRHFEGCDVVFHLAAAHKDFGVSEEEFYSVNRDGTGTLLEAMNEAKIHKLVFFSSVAVYGTNREPSHEKVTPVPDNPYGKSKLDAEEIISRWGDAADNRRVVIVRPAVVYGPRHRANMLRLLKAIDRGYYLTVGQGKNVKSITYVENVVDACMFLYGISDSNPQLIANIADLPQMTSAEIAEVLANRLGKRPPRFSIPLSLIKGVVSPLDLIAKITGYDMPVTSKRIEKFSSPTIHDAPFLKELGWKQPVDPGEGLGRMVEWYKSER